MSDVPFGFGLPPGGDDPQDPKRREPGQDNPFAGLFAGDPAAIGAAFQQLGQLLSYSGGPVNWDLARDVARQAVAGARDQSVSEAQRRAVEEAVRLAELWLDPVTTIPAGTTGALAWSRAEWVEATLPVWRQLVEPVAGRVVEAMGEVVPEEMKSMAGPLLGVMRQMGGAMFGAQVGQGLGTLASDVVGASDIGLPFGPEGKAVLLPANVTTFGEGLGIDEDQIRLYLALREVAHQRLFAHVPWLRGHLLGAVEAYARGIRVDVERLEQAIGQLDPTNPEGLQEALSSGMFEPEQTPEQRAALGRLETALALVEGWVDEVVNDAATAHLSSAAALRETLRRRRATGGPGEQTFATLVGLQLRPRRLRDAAALWRGLRDRRGIDGRDAVWSHPDLLPTADDLDDPAAYVDRAELDLAGLEDAGSATPEEGSAAPEDRPPENRPPENLPPED
jgi:putative hydrolase